MWSNHSGEIKHKSSKNPRMSLRKDIEKVWEFIGTINEVLQDKDVNADDVRRLCVALDSVDDAAEHINAVLDRLNISDESYTNAIEWWMRRMQQKHRAMKQKPKDLKEHSNSKHLRPYFARMQINPEIADCPPPWRWGKAKDIGSKFAAEWNSKSRTILLNPDFYVFRESRAHWISKFPGLDPDTIDEAILNVYGSVLCALVVHVESPSLRRSGWTKEQQESLRSKVSLTASVLNLIGPETIIATQLGGLIGIPKKKEK